MISTENIKNLLLSKREQTFEQLYEQAFPLVAAYVSRLGGSFDDARDIFQDSLVLFYEKATGENFQLRSSAEAYVLGIAKHLWAKKFRQDRRNISFDEMEKEISIPPDFYSSHEPENRLIRYLEMAGQKCMDMLQSFYYSKMSMQEIAETFGFGSTRSATVQKFKCLEKVRKNVKASVYEEVFE